MSDIIRNQRTSEPHLATARYLRCCQTPAEQCLRQHLRGGQLSGLRFRRQPPLGPYIVELDGPIHDQQVDYDHERDAYLTAHGLRILRFPNDAVLDVLDTVLATIRHATAPP